MQFSSPFDVEELAPENPMTKAKTIKAIPVIVMGLEPSSEPNE